MASLLPGTLASRLLNLFIYGRPLQHGLPQFAACRKLSDKVYTPDDTGEPPIPVYRPREGEPVELQRARLLYQSRKRGMLENGLLLSTFAARHLNQLSESQLKMYDNLINLPSNDWDIYYWVTGNKPTPEEYNNEVMDMLKEHAKNRDRERRIRQPDLHST